MKASFNGREYLHEMIAERQREVLVSVTALRLMQEFYGNPYFSFRGCPDSEAEKWATDAEMIVPRVVYHVDLDAEMAAAGQA